MKTLNFTFKLLLSAFAFLFSTTVFGQVQTSRYTSMSASTKAYYEYLPQGYDAKKKGGYPLLLFIHGAGEKGSGTPSTLPLILKHGPPALINKGSFPTSFTVNSTIYKLIVISPQFAIWPSPQDIDAIITYLIAHYNVDASRIYLTGLSMGGGVCWQYAGYSVGYAKRIAGILPFAGASAPTTAKINSMAQANLPVWAFHNAQDNSVSPAWSKGYVDGINKYIPKPSPAAKLTLFNAGGHNCWASAYACSYKENGLNCYQWMLQYSRGGIVVVPPAANKAPVVYSGKDTTITLPVNSVTLKGTATDNDGKIVSYSWTKIIGPATFTISNSKIINPKISNLVEGHYKFRLTVKDDDSASSYDDVAIYVNPKASIVTKTINVNITNQLISYDDSQWNNWSLYSQAASNIISSAFKYSDGTRSSASATLSYSSGISDNTDNYIGGMAPEEVLRMTSYSNTARTLIIKGLSVSKKYSIDLYASRTTNKSSSIFSLGSKSDTISTYYNGDENALFEDLVPATNGIITINIKSGSLYNYLNGFTITEKSSSSSARTSVATNTVENEDRTVSIDKPALNIYPNPVRDKFMLQLSNQYKGAMNIQITDISGRTKKTINYNKNQSSEQLEIFANELPAGIYIVQVKMGTYSMTKKILKL